MIDSLVMLLPRVKASRTPRNLGIEGRPFVLVTLHRPSNVDEPARLKLLMENLAELGRQFQVVFPMHPRTRKMLKQYGITAAAPGLLLTEPLSYLDFMALESQAALVITDSGGIQEETSYLGIPCLTVRPNTERPVTLTEGTNRLLDPEKESLSAAAQTALMTGRRKTPCVIEGWDGKAAQRITLALSKAVGVQRESEIKQFK
jgi:UDP-N-acetylglucosamine 2-epimerase (non-hydrolysing)